MVLLTLEKPYCDPFREMLAHPQVVARLNAMCGPGFRFDHGPHFIGGVKGTEGLVMHGAGEPHRPYVGYHHQAGEFHCQGVTVSWFLADAGAGDGGFACVPGSHKSREPMPAGVRSCDDDMGVVEQPEVEAGDVLFLHGRRPDSRHPAVERRPRAALHPVQVRRPHRHPERGLARAVPARALLARRDRRRHER